PSRQSEKPLVQPAIIVRSGSTEVLAERERFELSIPFRVCPLSRRIVSTTHAPLRAKLQSPRRNERGRSRVSGAIEKNFAAARRKYLPSRRRQLPCGDSVWDGSPLASPSGPPRLWDRWRHTPDAARAHAPARRRTWRTARL